MKKLVALVMTACLCFVMAVPAFAADGEAITRRAEPCPSCFNGSVVSHTEKISSHMVGTVSCTHGHFGYEDAIIEEKWQRVYSCTSCGWINGGDPYIVMRNQCLYDLVS